MTSAVWEYALLALSDRIARIAELGGFDLIDNFISPSPIVSAYVVLRMTYRGDGG